MPSVGRPLAGLLTVLASAAGIALVAAPTSAVVASVPATWTAIQAPSSVAGDPVELAAVDCPVAGDCVAVGEESVENGYASRPVVEVESDGAWSAELVPMPAGSASGQLTSISCPAVGSCVAVGTWSAYTPSTATDSNALIETLSGGTWTGLEATAPSGGIHAAAAGALVSVDCPAAGDCVAVGTAIAAGQSSPISTGLILTVQTPHDPVAASSWVATVAPESTKDHAGEDAALSSVSCTRPGSCRAVGYGTADNQPQALEDDDVGGSWAAGDVETPADDGGADMLTSVSCVPGGTRCVASGKYVDKDFYPFLDAWSGETALASSVPTAPTSSARSELLATSCAADGGCQSVGDEGDNDATDDYAVHGTFATTDSFTAEAMQRPADAWDQGVDDVATTVDCVTGGTCVSTGSYRDSAEDLPAFIDTRLYASDGSLSSETATGAPLPANAESGGFGQSTLPGLSCTDATHCVAVGQYADTSGVTDGLIDSLGGSSTPPPVAPSVTRISPATGATAGGRKVAIYGSDLTGVTAVDFGSTAATKVTDVSAGEVTAVAPARRAGRVDVRVSTAAGESAPVSADRFTYVAAPVVTAISPAHGPHAGGTTVTIHGRNFVSGTTVRFGSAAGRRVTVVSSKKLTVRSPRHAKGLVSVRVKTVGGTSAAVRTSRFTYR